jgi:diguanylate cyclase (GGDEF)-like protein
VTEDNLILLQQKVTKLRAEGKYKETIENCYDLIKNAMELKDYKSILTAYINLGASYYCIGDIESAFNSLSNHREICDKYGDDADRMNSSNILFLLYEYNKDCINSKNTLKKTIDLGKKLKKYNIVSNAYSNYSHICMIEKNYAEALEMANIGLEMAKLHEPASKILEIRVKLNIGKALIGLKDFNNSKALIYEIMNDKVLDSFIREKSQAYDLQGHWYIEQKLYKEALEAFNEAKALAQSYNDVYLLKSIQEKRCRICDEIGDRNLGYEVQKEYISLLKEISDRELASTALKLQIKHDVASMERKANTDYLTGLYNRSYIESISNEWLKDAYKRDESITCIAFDIDKFKSFNDNYGHLFGDEVIKKVAKTCLNIIKKPNLVGRFGGDEFVIVLKGISLEDSKNKAEQILENVRNLEIYKDGKLIPITISIGVADNLGCTIMDFKELFNLADMRLYKAKESGRNNVCAFD